MLELHLQAALGVHYESDVSPTENVDRFLGFLFQFAAMKRQNIQDDATMDRIIPMERFSGSLKPTEIVDDKETSKYTVYVNEDLATTTVQ